MTWNFIFVVLANVVIGDWYFNKDSMHVRKREFMLVNTMK
jgi:hypothetical protein